MPKHIIEEVVARNVRVHDELNGQDVEVKSVGHKNVTLTGADSKRLFYGPADTPLFVHRVVSTEQEQLEALYDNIDMFFEDWDRRVYNGQSWSAIGSLTHVLTDRSGEVQDRYFNSFKLEQFLSSYADAKFWAQLPTTEFLELHDAGDGERLETRAGTLRWINRHRDELAARLLSQIRFTSRSTSTCSNLMDDVEWEVAKQALSLDFGMSLFGKAKLLLAHLTDRQLAATTEASWLATIDGEVWDLRLPEGAPMPAQLQHRLDQALADS